MVNFGRAGKPSSPGRRKAAIDDKIIANTLHSRLAPRQQRGLLPSGAWLETAIAKPQPRRALHAGDARGRPAGARDPGAGDPRRRKHHMRKSPTMGSAAAAAVTSDTAGCLDAPQLQRATGSESGSSGLPLQRRLLSDGTEVALPIRFFDAQCLLASFVTDPERAAELLTGTGLQVAVQEDGKAMTLLACFEYRRTDIGPYNEVCLGVSAIAPGDRMPSALRGESPGHHDVGKPRRAGNLGLQQVRRPNRRARRSQKVLDDPA